LSAGAFEGIKVLDAASLVAGPMIATYMAEYGADVIKVEMPGTGDPIRQWGANKDDVNLMWKSLGRNKRTVSLNLREPAAQELFRRFAAEVDVVIVNTRPSTLERWGLTWEDLSALNEKLIMIHVTGYGSTGPNSDKPGFGTIMEAMSGFAHITGEADGPPTLPGFMLADCTAAVHGAFAVSAALLHRERTGEGQFIDLSLLEPLARFAEQATLVYDQLGKISSRVGNKWSISVPRNTYKTADGRWIALSGSSQSIALKVFDAIGRPELRDDPEYADPLRRIANRDMVDGLIADWISERPLDKVLAKFDAAGVAAGPVYDAEQLMQDPHVKARGTFVAVKDDDLTEVRVQAPVARMSKTPGVIRHLGRAVGADNNEVYGELLGLTDNDVAELRDRHVI
jgi:crotonobetainyl-CoA:carnitine CoA-transferase CaiB-like acyl-CoA transferase